MSDNSLSVFTPGAPLVLVGAGKMGGALLSGWLDRGLDPKAVTVVDPSPPADTGEILKRAGIVAHATPPSGVAARVVVVAVKPQIIAGVLPALRAMFGPKTIALSIAAGATLANLEAGLGPVAIVRSIPNTPAMVGRGITGAIANTRVDEAGRALIEALLEAVGEVVWVDREGLIDAVTAVSGSGPAYVFLLAEVLAQAAEATGLPPDLAAKLARATVTGAGELLYRSDLPPDQLRKNVTSPNGTTAAALAVLMGEGGVGPLMVKAVAAARKRSEELSG
jgi:pyrroline-5-carboxylate reductase